jgi:SAM-dependent methyltransferase
MMTQQEFLADPLSNCQWYHNIELFPGTWTRGFSFDNIVVTRRMLDLVDVSEQTCLDVGAMDGLISYLLERRNASRVVAYDRSTAVRDRVTNGERFELARRALNSKVQFLYDMPFASLHEHAVKIGVEAFDVTVFSGVLYHMFDPMTALAHVRNLTRTGGVAVIETAGILSPEKALFANAHGRFYGNDDYWFVSAGCLEYWLRFFHFQPLDCCYLHHLTQEGLEVVRMAVVCRALPGYLAENGDAWMRQQDEKKFSLDFVEHFRPPAESRTLTPVPVASSNRPLVWRDEEQGILDLYSSLRLQDPITAAQHPELLQLALADR